MTNRFDTNDALYDTAWSETNDNQLIAACGDGSILLYDVNVEKYPVTTWKEHSREVYSVNWNLVTKDSFVSSSWDGTIKMVGQLLTTRLGSYPCAYANFHV